MALRKGHKSKLSAIADQHYFWRDPACVVEVMSTPEECARSRRNRADIVSRSCGWRNSFWRTSNPFSWSGKRLRAASGPAGATADPAEVRDDAEDILRATVSDMQSDQTGAEQAEKSKGASRHGGRGGGLPRASSSHGRGRVTSGFDLWAVVAEYRALRASVLRLWRESGPAPDLRDVDDLTRFNESIDQSLTHAVRSYVHQVERDREALLASEQASRQGSRGGQSRQGRVSGHAQPRDAHAAQRHRRLAQHLAARGRRDETSSGGTQGHRAQHQGAGATHR